MRLNYWQKKELMSAVSNPLPDIEYLKECFEIDSTSITGLRWKERPLNHFPSPMHWGRFHSFFAGKPCGLIRAGYYSTKIGKRNVFNHRIIYAIYNNIHVNSSLVIDHIDRDKLNNSPENLRAISRSANKINSDISPRNTSGIKGVSWVRGKWHSSITLHGKTFNLGYFHEKEDAINARVLAEKTLHKI